MIKSYCHSTLLTGRLTIGFLEFYLPSCLCCPVLWALRGVLRSTAGKPQSATFEPAQVKNRKYRSSDLKRDCNSKRSTKADTWTEVECWMEQTLYSCQQNHHLRERERNRERKGPSSALTAWWMGRNAMSVSRRSSLCTPCAGNPGSWCQEFGQSSWKQPQSVQTLGGSCVTPKQWPVPPWQPK